MLFLQIRELQKYELVLNLTLSITRHEAAMLEK